MAREIRHVVLIVVLLVSVRLGASAPNWITNLRREIYDMTHNIQKESQQLGDDIRAIVDASLRPSLEEVRKTIASLPLDSQGHVITSGGANSISFSSVNGISRTIMSGHTPNGQLYVREIVERNDGKHLYHDETFYNPTTNNTERIHWKLDLTNPNAKPEYFKDEDAKSESSKDVEIVEPEHIDKDGKPEK